MRAGNQFVWTTPLSGGIKEEEALLTVNVQDAISALTTTRRRMMMMRMMIMQRID